MTSSEPGAAELDLIFSLVAEVEVPAGLESEDLERLTAHALAAEGATGEWAVTVALVGDERLQALHRDFMGIDTPTDVMTFPTSDAGDEPQGGELVISVDHARTQAGVWGMSEVEEIHFLVVHGLLHLMGWRDDTDAAREVMLFRQRELIDRRLAESQNNE